MTVASGVTTPGHNESKNPCAGSGTSGNGAHITSPLCPPPDVAGATAPRYAVLCSDCRSMFMLLPNLYVQRHRSLDLGQLRAASFAHLRQRITPANPPRTSPHSASRQALTGSPACSIQIRKDRHRHHDPLSRPFATTKSWARRLPAGTEAPSRVHCR